MITQEDNIVLQSYFTFKLLAELQNNSFFDSDYFKGMDFGNSYIKEGLEQVGIDNQGTILISLYAMLVVPKEIHGNDYEEESEKINEFLKVHTQSTESNYSTDRPNIDFLRHIRNAVAHARVSFEPANFVIFSDEFRENKFTTKLPLKHLDEFIHILQIYHLKHIEEILGRNT